MWNVCYLSEGVSQVAVDDPVIQMFLLIKKFTDLVAGGQDRETQSDSSFNNISDNWYFRRVCLSEWFSGSVVCVMCLIITNLSLRSSFVTLFWIYGKTFMVKIWADKRCYNYIYCIWFQSWVNYSQLGLLCQSQQPPFIKLDHTPDLQQLQQNLHTSHNKDQFTVTLWNRLKERLR